MLAKISTAVIKFKTTSIESTYKKSEFILHGHNIFIMKRERIRFKITNSKMAF